MSTTLTLGHKDNFSSVTVAIGAAAQSLFGEIRPWGELFLFHNQMGWKGSCGSSGHSSSPGEPEGTEGTTWWFTSQLQAGISMRSERGGPGWCLNMTPHPSDMRPTQVSSHGGEAGLPLEEEWTAGQWNGGVPGKVPGLLIRSERW